eukprot:gb/GEZJ01006540.1/.p1 GENE.gb/GEZJ01006540.1/~~gb/GEZJ01006540.1/.p1  ORF type:complete len:132 (-),score=7.86 gb/GEZJ01006540.1/:734-1129(-)
MSALYAKYGSQFMEDGNGGVYMHVNRLLEGSVLHCCYSMLVSWLVEEQELPTELRSNSGDTLSCSTTRCMKHQSCARFCCFDYCHHFTCTPLQSAHGDDPRVIPCALLLGYAVAAQRLSSRRRCAVPQQAA